MLFKEPKIFQRGILDTIIGFLHIFFGFTSTLWVIIRIGIIGYSEVFKLGTFFGIYNYFFESLTLLLWISGIGILRTKPWGKNCAAVWAGLTIIYHLSAQSIRNHYWDPIIKNLTWGEIFILYYAFIYLAGFAAKQIKKNNFIIRIINNKKIKKKGRNKK